MFTQEDLENKTIDGKQYVTFQPNTIVYPMESAGYCLQNGIVFHTTYSGKTMEDILYSPSTSEVAKLLMYGIQTHTETHLVVLISIRLKPPLPRYCLNRKNISYSKF